MHIPFLLNLVLACLGMALRDFCSTMVTVAQARGHEQTAARMDALGDVATALTTLTGVGAILVQGLNPMTILTIVMIALTSYVGTIYWTRFARRRTDQDPVLSNHEQRITRIEREQEAWNRAIRKILERARGVETKGRDPRQLEEVKQA